MLLDTNNTRIQLVFQQYVCRNFRFENNGKELWLDFNSKQETKDVYCKYCGNNDVEVHDNYTTKITDMPVWPGVRQLIRVTYHKYKCRCCNKVFNEDISFKDPNARITTRAAQFIKTLLSLGLATSSVSQITGIHWDTIRKLHTQTMKEALETRTKLLKEQGYKPTYLAVDEFAIHKGQSYATCVMDLIQGDVLWVGKGRNMEDFRKFFTEFDMDYLREVKAVAMDMNAAFNVLVEEYLPEAAIVYDRYHIQAQFGKEVLTSVRLRAAKEHQKSAKSADEERKFVKRREDKRECRKMQREENKKFKELKNARWVVLTNSNNLSDEDKASLKSILEEHQELAVCYAMKEEMNRLFSLTEEAQAREGWTKWFEAAKESEIPELVKFAQNKEKYIEGLISHAEHQISTGKLEGLNNKIKVAKRVGYGFRDDDYFFTLVRYITLPKNFMLFPQNT